MNSSEARITIGQTLMAASAGLLPVLTALVTFVFESRDAPGYFWLLVALAAVAYLLSIMFGGWGIEQTAAGIQHSHFNRQAVSILVGTALIAAAFVSTNPRPPAVDPVIANLQSELLDTRQELGGLEERVSQLQELLNTNAAQEARERKAPMPSVD